MDNISDAGLSVLRIALSKIPSSECNIEPEILSVLASKCEILQTLCFEYNSKSTTEQAKQAFSELAVNIIHLKPQNLQEMSFFDCGFSGSLGDKICFAL